MGRISRVGPCSIWGCNGKIKARGLCSRHYYGQQSSHGVCSVEGCGRAHYAKGYCQRHWRRWRSTGDPGPPELERQRRIGVCSVEGCGRNIYGKGLCQMHWQRLRKHGDPLKVISPGRPNTSFRVGSTRIDPFVLPVGTVFGRLVILGLAGPDKHGNRRYKVRCLGPDGKGHEPDAVFEATGSYLRNGDVKSCGCLKRKHTDGSLKGVAKHPLYQTFWNMHRRCEQTSDRSFHRYGGRGITVCERWTGPGGVENFIKDMGERPSRKHSLERRDNDGPYSPENCYWATSKQQRANQRPRASLDVLYRFGLREPLQELSVLLERHPYGSVEFVLTTDAATDAGVTRLGPFRAANTP